MSKNSAKWYGKMGHCPICQNVCSERTPTPCYKCQRLDPKAASAWFASHKSQDYAGSVAPVVKAVDPLAIFNVGPCAHDIPGTCDYC